MTPQKPNLRRIAEAMVEGIDGRSFASDDAKELHRLYEVAKEGNPHLSCTECSIRARMQFIYDVLTEGSDATQLKMPLWRKRPTGPGLWLCASNKRGQFPREWMGTGIRLSSADIAKGAPFDTACVYGPIPERPAEIVGPTDNAVESPA